VLGDTENFFYDIYREKVSRYWVYHDTCFASGVTEVGESSGGGGQLREQLPRVQCSRQGGTKIFTKN